MNAEELRAELAGRYGQSAERVAFIEAELAERGFCPFIAAGRQYVASRYLRAVGYVIEDITEVEGAEL